MNLHRKTHIFKKKRSFLVTISILKDYPFIFMCQDIPLSLRNYLGHKREIQAQTGTVSLKSLNYTSAMVSINVENIYRQEKIALRSLILS